MRILKLRKVGNSNVVSIPREFAAAGFVPDADVAVELGEGGVLLLKVLPPDERAQTVQAAMHAAQNRRKRGLDILEEYDRAGQLALATN